MNWDLLISTLVTIGTLGTTMWVMLKFLLKDIHLELSGIRKETNREFSAIREELNREFSAMREELKGIKSDLKEIKIDIRSLDKRLTGLECSFEERGRWEARLELRKTKSDE